MQTCKIGDCNRIGGIVRFRDGIQFEYDFQSILNLLFLGGSVSRNPPFHLKWSEFMNLDSFFLKRQENSSASLCHIDSGFLVIEEEKFLDSADGRMIGFYEVFEVFCDIKYLQSNIDFRWGRDDSKIQN